jgi:glycosyltransferase involved in cell wall biosynthesis
MVGHKDQATLLRAARHIATERPDVVVVVIGDGELRSQLERQRRELDLESTVFFAGFILEAEQFLPAFDVFVMSSAMEGLGSIVLDAFAAGVPIAATAGGGLPELIRHRETGLLVPVGNDLALSQAVIELLTSDSLVARMTQKARDVVREDFSVERMASSYLEIYRTIINH